jgi:hypothetical protein
MELVMAKVVDFPRTNTKVYWSALFDNSPRHCWEDANGTSHVEGKWDQICNGKHDPRRGGQVEWMRFIHAVNGFLIVRKNLDNNEDLDMSKFGGFGSPDMLGAALHDNVDHKHWSGYEAYPDYTIFVDVMTRFAFIECYNEELIETCKEAYAYVQKQYDR